MAERYQWTVPCDFCQKPAKHHCNTCGDVLCNSCKAMHSKSKSSKDHSVVPYSEKVELLSNIHIMCGEHTNRKAEYWCPKCDDVACATCVTSTHHGHKLSEIGEALRNKRKEITTETERIREETLREWEELLQASKSIGDTYTSDLDKVEESLLKQADKMHKAIDEVLSKKRKILKDMKDSHIASGTAQTNTLTKGIQNISTTISDYEALRDGTSIDLLRFKVDELHSKIPTKPEQLKSMTAPTFTSGNISSEKVLADMFGTLSLEGDSQAESKDSGKELPSSLTVMVPKPASEVCSHPEQMSPSPAAQSPTLMSTPTAISSFDPGYSLPYIVCTGQRLAWVKTGDHRLQLMDRNGSVKDTINTDFLYNDIALTPHGDVLFTDCNNKCIKSVSHSKAVSILFRTEYDPCGICCLQSGNIFVTFTIDKVVIIYNINGQKLHELAGPFRRPRRVTENKANNDIYICEEGSSFLFSPGKLLVYDATYKYRYDYSGSDTRSFYPMEVCTDNIGHVLITDMKNHRVHILDNDGRFLQYILTSDIGLKFPRYIDVDGEGNAWVGEGRGKVKIARYLSM